MGPMSFVDRALGGHRLFVEMPAGVADWVPSLEVALQEGIRAVAFHHTELSLLPDALALFGRRARVGVWGMVAPEAVRDAAAAGAHFVTSPVSGADLADAAGDTPFLPGGLTPSELVAAPGEEVQVVPADAMPMAYGRSLRSLLGGRAFIATGRLERFQLELWYDAGASAIGLSGDALLGPSAGDLGELRDRCRSFVEAVRKATG